MKPLTSLLLLLLWVYWQATNHFTAYTATRSPRPEVPGVGDWLQSKLLGLPAASTEAFRVNLQNADTSSSPPLPRFLLCCHKLVSLRWCTGLMLIMLIMLMRANKIAASQNLLGVLRGVVCNPPSQSEIGTFFSPFSPRSLAGTERGWKGSHELSSSSGFFWCERNISELYWEK